MGQRVVYCHGLPGAPDELSAFEASLPQHVHALDRLTRSELSYEASVLAAFDRLGVDEPVAVAGFSLGAMAAVRIAARRPHMVRKLILISPAAPLQLGDFLPAMAGRQVFQAAQHGEWALRIFTTAQASFVAVAPGLVVKMMFAGSSQAEQRLLTDRRFVDAVASGLRMCLGAHQVAYRRELLAYVSSWAHVIRDVQCPTEIWSGSDDNWAPAAMAEAYKAQLGALATMNICPGLGHYSTLSRALSRLA